MVLERVNIGETSGRAVCEFSGVTEGDFGLMVERLVEGSGVEIEGQSQSKSDRLRELRVIYQDDVTVLIDGEDRYLAKPEKGEKYDAEKGLMVCLLKYLGVKTTEILELSKNAKKYKKSVKGGKGR